MLGWSCLDAKRVVAYSTAWHVSVLTALAMDTTTMVKGLDTLDTSPPNMHGLYILDNEYWNIHHGMVRS